MASISAALRLGQVLFGKLLQPFGGDFGRLQHVLGRDLLEPAEDMGEGLIEPVEVTLVLHHGGAGEVVEPVHVIRSPDRPTHPR